MPRSLIVRHATSRDRDAVLDFYRSNSHPNLKARGDERMVQALREERKLIVIQEGPLFLGAAAIFEHLDGAYNEAGAARVVLNGYGLQKVLLWARTIHAFLTDPPAEEFFSVVRDVDNDDSRRSRRSLSNGGFQLWNDVPQEVVDLKGSGKKFYRLPKSALQQHAQQLLQARDRPLPHRSGVDAVQLVLKLEAFTYYEDALDLISRGDLSCLAEVRRPDS